MEEIARANMKEILKAALKWWEEEAQYLTTSIDDELEWDNVFDDDPKWAKDARQVLSDN